MRQKKRTTQTERSEGKKRERESGISVDEEKKHPHDDINQS